MIRILTFVLFWSLSVGTIALASDSQCALWYGQCGGINWSGPTCCYPGSACTYNNPYYSQCLVVSNTGSCVSVYQQCGGINYSGTTCCQAGTSCVVINDYYHQCIYNPNIPSEPETSVVQVPTTTSKAIPPSSSPLPNTSSIHTSGFVTTSSAEESLAVESSSVPVPVSAESSSTSAILVASSVESSTDESSSVPAPISSAKTSTSLTVSTKTSSLPLPPASSSSSTFSFQVIPGGVSGNGITTRYWDCCKPSCSWPGKALVSSPVSACAADGVSVVDVNEQSACNGGSAYSCNDQTPFAINSTLAYGFAAASVSGYGESQSCCTCMLLTFTDNNTPIYGKQLVVQITNTGDDLSTGTSQFDLAIPGGGVGYFTSGCQSQWNAPSSGWGQPYGGVDSRSQCQALLPSPLQPGCDFRFDWMEGVSNPNVHYQEIVCPAEIVSISGCQRL